MTVHRIPAFIALVFAFGLGVAVYAQQGRATNITSDVLRRASTAGDALPGSWLSYGRNQAETRYSTLKQIDSTNAKRLGLAWSYVMGAGGGNQEGTPLMWNNTLYGITSWSVVFALDARTGQELWRWDPEINQTTVRPVICCGIVNRGIALYNGMIIAPAIDGRLFALNATTGDALWHARLGSSVSNGPSTYELDGTQYLLVGAGDTLWAFAMQHDERKSTPASK